MFDFVINPAGASGHTGEVWKQTEEILKAGDVSYRVHFSSRETGVEEIVRELTSSGEDISLVIVGGDGTMNQAVNGIADFSRTKVGFIPCGSGNDLARSLGLSDDIKRNVETILRNTVIRNLDVGEAKLFGCTGYPQGETVVRRFNNGAGIGFDAQVCEEADISKAKDFLNKLKLGKLVYITTALKTIFNAPRIEAEITTDGEVKKFNAKKKTFRVWGKSTSSANKNKKSKALKISKNTKYLLKTCGTLKKGSTNSKCVKSLQKFLQSKGYYKNHKVNGKMVVEM